MCEVVLNNITGEPPYTIQVCDYFGVSCLTIGYFTGYIPPSLTLTIPSPYDVSPMVKIVVYDLYGCVSETTLTMMTPTPTQSVTPTITVSPTVTPTTQSPTPTPTLTSTPSPTPLCSNVQTSLTENSTLTLYNFKYVSGTFGIGDTVTIQIGWLTDPNLIGLSIGDNLSIIHDGTYEALYFQITNSTVNSGVYVEWDIQITANYSFAGFVDGDNYSFCYLVPSQTPTQTPTLTPTPSVSPSSVSSTPTPTNTLTPTVTPTVTKTTTPTITVSPSLTPTSSPLPPTKAFLFIEPQTGSTQIGLWMSSLSYSFYGFTNGTAPTQNQNKFNLELNAYVDFSGWTSGLFPTIINQDVPQTTGGNDAFGNPIVAYNFKTTQVSANTVSGKAWFTWMIPTGMTNGLYQKKIDYSTSSPSMPPTTVNTEPTIFSYYFTYTGSTIPQTTYRVYTTYPSPNFNLLNTSDIYFKGNTVG